MGGCVTLKILGGECGRGGAPNVQKFCGRHTCAVRSPNKLGFTNHIYLATLICGLPLRRQADRVGPAARARAATSAAVGAAPAADERPPCEAEVALLDAVPAVLQAVLAALDLVVYLRGRDSNTVTKLQTRPQ